MDESVLQSWKGIMLLVLSSGLIAALTSSGMQWVKEYRAKAADRKMEASLEAIFLVRELDTLAVRCANSIWEHYEIFNQIVDTPEAGSYPGAVRPEFDIGKQSVSKIDKGVAAQIVWLETEIQMGEELIRSAWFHDALDYYQAHDQRANLVGYFGHKALEAAAELRKIYQLKSNQYQWGMTGVSDLLKKSAGAAEKYLAKEG